MKKITGIFAILTALAVNNSVYGQADTRFEKIAAEPKTIKTFPANYKIALPGLTFEQWDHDFELYYKYLTPALRKTQATMSSVTDGVHIMVNPNSIMPHAQLDTGIAIKNEAAVMGLWRMITYRKLQFNDSANIATRTLYRAADTVLEDKSSDEAFANFEKNQFQLYAREAGKTSFKKKIASKFKIESNRYLMLYKFFKSGSGVSQIGIDENGYLVLNYPTVIEYTKKGAFIAYYAFIEQFIFEKVKE